MKLGAYNLQQQQLVLDGMILCGLLMCGSLHLSISAPKKQKEKT
jgi:hypothetical protein